MSGRSYPSINYSNTISTQEAELLKNSRRRGIIKALSGEQSMLDSFVGLFLEQEREPVDKRSVTEQVAVMEEGKPLDEISDGKIKSIQATAHQNHFPVLDEEEFLNYYPDEGLVEPLDPIDEYVQMVEERPHKESVIVPNPESGPDLTVDDTYEVLSNERRRYTLGYIGNRTQQEFELGELSEHVAEREKVEEGPITSDDRKKAYIGLAQCHLPKLDDVEVIEYDDDRKTLERGKYFEEVSGYLPGRQEQPSSAEMHKAKAFSIFPLF